MTKQNWKSAVQKLSASRIKCDDPDFDFDKPYVNKTHCFELIPIDIPVDETRATLSFGSLKIQLFMSCDAADIIFDTGDDLVPYVMEAAGWVELIEHDDRRIIAPTSWPDFIKELRTLDFNA